MSADMTTDSRVTADGDGLRAWTRLFYPTNLEIVHASLHSLIEVEKRAIKETNLHSLLYFIYQNALQEVPLFV